MRTWSIHHHDRAVTSLGQAMECVDGMADITPEPIETLEAGIKRVHDYMFVAMVMRPPGDYAYSLWVDDDGHAMPVYVVQPEGDGFALRVMVTPDVEVFFEERLGDAWVELIQERWVTGLFTGS